MFQEIGLALLNIISIPPDCAAVGMIFIVLIARAVELLTRFNRSYHNLQELSSTQVVVADVIASIGMAICYALITIGW